MAEQQYPEAIICRSGWKKGIKPEDILAGSEDAVVGHWLEGPREKHFSSALGEGMESLRMSALPLNRMANLSTSLLGGLFEMSHFHFRQKEKGDEVWNGKDDVGPELISPDNYSWMDEVSVIGWKIMDIHGCTFNYPRSFNQKSDYDEYKKNEAKKADEKGKALALSEWEHLDKDKNNSRTINIDGCSRVNHDPKLLNFWHFVIDLYPSDLDEEALKSGASKGWRGKLASKLQDQLMRTYIDMAPPYTPPSLSDKRVWEL